MADNQKMILNLFAGLQQALFLGDPLKRGEFVSFLQPGQFISTNLMETSNSEDMAIQSDICKILLDSSFVNQYEDSSYSSARELPGSVDQVYEDILEHVALPFEQLTPSQLQEIDTLQQWLQGQNANYTLYQDRFLEAQSAYDTLVSSQNPNPGDIRLLAARVDQGRNNWQTFGQRGLYDRKYSRYVYLTEPDPTTFWESLRQKRDDQKQSAPIRRDYLQTFLVPAISSWSNGGWSHFENIITESQTYDYSHETSWGGGASVGFGLFSIGGKAGETKKFTQSQSDVSSISIKLDYRRVRIDRRWLTEDVFGYKFWSWNKQFADDYVSTGGNPNVNPPQRPVGRMPVLPQYLIVVKDVELISTFSHNDTETFNSSLQSQLSFGWGPFSVSGSYEESTGTKTTHASFDGVTLRIPQPQIIARAGILVPKSPDPNSKLAWQDDAWKPWEEQSSTKTQEVLEKDYQRLALEEKLLEAREEADRLAKRIWEQKREAVMRGGNA